MVQHGLALLLGGTWDADKMKDGDVLGERAGDAVRRTELSNTKGRDDDTYRAFLNASIAVCGISRVQFVAVGYTSDNHSMHAEDEHKSVKFSPVASPFQLRVVLDVVQETYERTHMCETLGFIMCPCQSLNTHRD